MTARIHVDPPDLYAQIHRIPTRLIDPSADNPASRTTVDHDLVRSIEAHGIIEPLVVRIPDGDAPLEDLADARYELIAGHRRLAAAVAAGYTRVPCVIRDDTDTATALELALAENIHRADLAPTEQAGIFARLIKLGRTQQQVADLAGVSQPVVSKRVALLRLPDVARAAVDSGDITVEEGAALAVLPKPEVEKLFGGGAPTDWEIRGAVRRHVEAKAHAKAVAELNRAGVTILDQQPRWIPEPGAPMRLGRVGANGIDPEAHRTEPCRAVYVETAGGLVEACTDPGRHSVEDAEEEVPESTSSETAPPRPAPKLTPAQQARRDWIAATDASNERRRSFCKDILTRARVIIPETFAARMLITSEWFGDAGEVALGLLGLPDGRDERAGVARAFIDTGGAQKWMHALALALGLAHTEAALDEEPPAGDPEIIFFLAHLQACGYHLDETEQALLTDADTDTLWSNT